VLPTHKDLILLNKGSLIEILEVRYDGFSGSAARISALGKE